MGVVGAGGVGDGRRDLVFLSYSHGDAEWAQALTGFLKPLVRSKRLRLWVDTANVRVGDEWHPEIGRAIGQSQLAVLLVSARFLESDYIMETELPALIAHGVRLAPILVGDCLWKHVPELKKVQWLHDPSREGAVSLVAADQFGERDRRLVRMCDRLLELLPDPGAAPVDERPAAVNVPAVAAVPAGTGRGKLFGVPELPERYLPREELAELVAAVVAVDAAGVGAVGLTGDVATVGLYGQGGIGKSVLAAALARDEGIRARFPDGVYWVTVGEKADVLAVQLDLLARLSALDPPPRRTVPDTRDRLAAVLADRRVLLVVDDVWSDAAALAFRVTGSRGRVLYTTRDPQVLAAARARPHLVDVLSPAAARALAAGILDVAPEHVPGAAAEAFAEVGRVALAVALLAAAVRGGGSWDQVAASLRRGADVYRDHPYAKTFKAMQIAVAQLPAELARALLGLAVFPPDIQIPVAAIARYWDHTRGRTAAQTADDLDLLAAANVLRLAGATVEFHDLQHDYLLLHAGKPALLHAALLDTYRALLPTGRTHP